MAAISRARRTAKYLITDANCSKRQTNIEKTNSCFLQCEKFSFEYSLRDFIQSVLARGKGEAVRGVSPPSPEENGLQTKFPPHKSQK